MRTSKYLLSTSKETPVDAEIISHQLMLRAGMVRKLASGLYNWLPLGLRVLQKVTNIIRAEMNQTGALEVLMPVVQPADLWHETNRYEQYGAALLKFKDRNDRDFVLGPTHEEVITDIARREIKSYKQLPVNLYQIQTKFRDEIRPRFGIMRSREFIMKDAYSFHLNQSSLDKTYQQMHQSYCNIFDNCGLKYHSVVADTGSIGGSKSHEFHVLADSGEDAIAFSDTSDYAANVELAEALKPKSELATPQADLQKVATKECKSVSEVADFLGVSHTKVSKTMIIADADNKLFALVLCGHHRLNETKVNKLPIIKPPFRFASEAEVNNIGTFGSLGPVAMSLPLIVDHAAATLVDFICGANETGFHFTGVNWGRDVKLPKTYDIREVLAGDPSPDGKGTLNIARGIEVGHIFQLGDKYSKSLKAQVLNETGKSQTMIMGCYGIGVTRIVAASIEQNHDDNGIIWPQALAPFSIAIVPINYNKNELVRNKADEIYQQLSQLGYEVLLDDRKERPGVMFSDMDLIGIPHRITISERGLKNNQLEYKHRQNDNNEDITVEQLVEFICTKI